MLEFEGRQIPGELKEIADARRTVLLVWDMQNDQAGGSFNKEALIRNAPPLIEAAAKAGVKTVYTRQTPFLWKDEAATWIRRAMRDQKVDHPSRLKPRRLYGSFGWNLMEPFQPGPGDVVIDTGRRTQLAVVGGIGWYRISGEPLLNRQIPFLASAGIAVSLDLP